MSQDAAYMYLTQNFLTLPHSQRLAHTRCVRRCFLYFFKADMYRTQFFKTLPHSQRLAHTPYVTRCSLYVWYPKRCARYMHLHTRLRQYNKRTMTPRQVGGVRRAGKRQTLPTNHLSLNALRRSYDRHTTPDVPRAGCAKQLLYRCLAPWNHMFFGNSLGFL